MRGKIIVWMTLFLGVVVSALLFPALESAFQANPIFNGMIISVLRVGIAVNFQQVISLGPESRWIAQRRRKGVPEKLLQPQLPAPLAKMLAEREGRLRLSAMATRSVLDGLRMRLDEHRDISRYLIGLLIFLGLLGTF